MTPPLLSIIIPAYNEESRLPGTLHEICHFLEQQSYTAEVLVVENGSNDRTLEIAQEISAQFPFVRAIHAEQRGKGIAVKRGMLEAVGAYRFICDVDLSMPITEVNRFIPPLMPQADVVIASREASGAVRYDEPQFRHFTGRLFNSVVRWFALPGLQDTQCGFKCFRADVAEAVFPYQTIHGWTFDVEVLYIARKRGYKIAELPIPWYYNAESKVRVFKDLWQVGRDLVRILYKSRRGEYDAPAKKA